MPKIGIGGPLRPLWRWHGYTFPPNLPELRPKRSRACSTCLMKQTTRRATALSSNCRRCTVITIDVVNSVIMTDAGESVTLRRLDA